ncbi:hypothetical protein ACFFX0_10585 [Citricoccus parietis]|uniref:Secreted protein n=1 Tax=Citricoccus parietis TaxID=592307 RepID=A0ABV5FY62_9MICC
MARRQFVLVELLLSAARGDPHPVRRTVVLRTALHRCAAQRRQATGRLRPVLRRRDSDWSGPGDVLAGPVSCRTGARVLPGDSPAGVGSRADPAARLR